MAVTAGWIRSDGTGVRLAVRVQPRAGVSGVQGLYDGALKIRLAAPPVDGAANRELVAFLAKRLGVPRSAIRITAGERGRRKTVAVADIDVERARTALTRTD